MLRLVHGRRASSTATWRTTSSAPEVIRIARDGRVGRDRAGPHDSAPARATPVRTRRTSGTPRRPAAARSSTWARHGIEAARYIVRQGRPVARGLRLGRDARPRATRRPARTTPSLILRFEDGRTATIDVVVVGQGRDRGPQRGLRRRAAGSSTTSARPRSGRSSSESGRATSPRRPTPTPAGSIPVPDEPCVHGYDEMMRHFVEAFRDGVEPRETFEDGLVVNSDHRRRLPLDAERPLGSRSRSRPWPAPRADDRADRRPPCPRVAARGDRAPRAARRRPRPTRSSRPASGAPRRSPRTAWSTCSGPATRGSRSRRCSRATARTRASTRSSSCR